MTGLGNGRLPHLIQTFTDSGETERTQSVRSGRVGSTEAVQQHASLDCHGADVTSEISVLPRRRERRLGVERGGFAHDGVGDRRLDLLFADRNPHGARVPVVPDRIGALPDDDRLLDPLAEAASAWPDSKTVIGAFGGWRNVAAAGFAGLG